MKRSKLVAYLDTFLELESFEGLDRSLNGLIVGGPDKEIHKVGFAVDACLSTFEKALQEGVDLIVVHHGLFWGSPLAITGTHYRRISTLLKGDLDLYVAHLPLDAHPLVGNNAVMAQLLGLQEIVPFASYKGKMLGYQGILKEAKDVLWIADKLGFKNPVVLPFGKTSIRSIGIVSGGASSDVYAALAVGLDCFITGEVEHQIYHDAQEAGITVIGGGHYHSEIFGVQALSEHLHKKFDIEVCFIANPTGL
ncbi:MAG: Nif3-like dinuclear metal center hexameric protein [Sphaerochaetaceae bacterium]